LHSFVHVVTIAARTKLVNAAKLANVALTVNAPPTRSVVMLVNAHNTAITAANIKIVINNTC